MSFSIDTSVLEPGDYTHTVSTANDSVAGSLTIEEPAPTDDDIGADDGTDPDTDGDNSPDDGTDSDTGGDDGPDDGTSPDTDEGDSAFGPTVFVIGVVGIILLLGVYTYRGRNDSAGTGSSGRDGSRGTRATGATDPGANSPSPSPSDSGGAHHGTPDTNTRIDNHLDIARTRAEDARQAREAGDYDRALAACGEALSAAEAAQAAAQNSAPQRRSEIENGLTKIRQLDDDIRSERDAYQTETDSLDTLAAQLDTAANQLETDPEATLTNLDDIESDLNDVTEQMARYEFPEASERLERLQGRCDDLREQATDALTNRAPTTIPTTPRLPLSYDDIEKGDPIGSGGNADVYYATTATDDGTVELALKEPRMSGTLTIETAERMMGEAETWQQLDDHDHIVSVVDYDSDPLPWIAMEYMDGGHLGECASEMDLQQKLWTAVTVTRGVRHAHTRGIAHLDLKPANILFRSVEDAWNVPKVADWGLSKHLLNHSKSMEGLSPHYAAPEQFAADEYGDVDHVTDVYQLGAVFYELFTGRPPFEGQPFEVMKQIESAEPTPPSEVADVPAALDDILLRALATEKTERHESVLYLRDDLQDLRDSS